MILDKLEEISEKLAAILPPSLSTMRDDLKQQFNSVLQAALSEHLHLVTRDEFDVQVKVLEKTRAKLEALTAKIETLETSKS
jgi:ubiquinone biosynthesis accessory factor UbiK